MKHKVGDVVITSGLFYNQHGIVVRVTTIDKGKVVSFSIDGKGFEGGHSCYFTPQEYAESGCEWDVDMDHPWLKGKPVESCCSKYTSKYCPECGVRI